MITEGKLAPGERLPSETNLCAALNVGRSTLREALRSLAFVGLVRVRAGDGTYVAEGSRPLLDRMMSKTLLHSEKRLAEIREARLLLETELVALAAKRANDRDRVRLKTLSEELGRSAAGKGRPYHLVDLDFHLAIAEASHNSVLIHLLKDIQELLSDWIAKSQEFPGAMKSAQTHHRKILQFVLSGNAEKARKEMRQHLETLHKAYALLSNPL